MRARRLAPLLVALLLVPVASAAEGTGHLDVEGAVWTVGPTRLHAPAADLLWDGEGVPVLALDAAHVVVERRGERVVAAETPTGQTWTLQSQAIHAQAEHNASTLRLEAGQGVQFLLLRHAAPLEAELGGVEVRPVRSALLFDGDQGSVGACREGEPCAAVAGAHEVRTASAAADLAGDLVLFLRGPTLVVEEGGRETRYHSGASEERSGPARTAENAYLVVRVLGAAGGFEGAGDLRWYAPAPSLDAETLRTGPAEGAIRVGLSGYRATDERVDLTGALRLALDPLPQDAQSVPDGQVHYAPRLGLAVSGDVRTVNLDASPMLTAQAAAPVGLAAAAAAAALAALAWFWPLVQFHATAALLPFYTRLQSPDLLTNGVRSAIYDIIRANPGISARAVHRLSDQSWGTVVYHLRQLERHHLVVSRTVGRTRNYYENHGKYRGMEVQLACLQSPRALILARIVLEHPGITQERLSEVAGFPQPTTSYYVRKLKIANLVEEERDGRYACYHPRGELERFVALADPLDSEAVVAARA